MYRPHKSGAVWQRIYETMISQERIHTEAHWGALTVYVWKSQCLIKVLALGAGISPLNFRFKVALVNCWHAFRRCRLVQSVRPRCGLILQRSLSPVKFRAQSPLWNHDMRFVCVCVGVCVCVRVCVCILYSDSAGSHKLRAWVLGRGTFPVHFHTMLISWQVQCAFRLRRPTQNKQRGLGLGPRPQHPPPPSHHPQHHHSTPHQPQHHHHHHHHHPQYHHFPPPRLKTIILNIIIIIINIIIILILNILNSILLYPPSLPTPIWVSCRDNGNCPTWPGVWLPYGIKSSWCLMIAIWH